MKQSLSAFFTGIGAKRLSEVEINPAISNQHEFNGVNEFREILGSEKKNFQGTFIYLADDPEESITEEGKLLTWYDARANHPRRTEYRLYYKHNSVLSSSNPGDLVVLGKTAKNSLAIIVAPEGSTSEHQIKWLFGLEEVGTRFIVKDIISHDLKLNYASKHIISALGFETEEADPSYLDILLEKFGDKFPTTAEFSEFARLTIKDVSPIEEPDNALMSYLEREELLFRTLEKHLVGQKLEEGFGPEGRDVDEFVKYSLSVQNRRKSRAGHSFENHLESLFLVHIVNYSRGKKTERNNKPDFLFPSIQSYHDATFKANLLTMLGVKTTAKDRWRQVLSEAEKIKVKHLITLEPAISLNQTDEMREQNLQLVIPAPLHSTFTPVQQKEIITLEDFIVQVKEKQERII